MEAKKRGIKVTCEVTPHHLFFTDKDQKKLGPFGVMKPPLRKTKDLKFLWANIKAIDCVATDHAPHTKKEKKSPNPPFGVTGIETSLPLMLTAANKEKIKLNEVIRLMHEGPKKIFNITTNSKTYTLVDMKKKYKISNKDLFTKCEWTPFENMPMQGRVEKVVIRGKEAFNNGQIKIKPGFGKNIYE